MFDWLRQKSSFLLFVACILLLGVIAYTLVLYYEQSQQVALLVNDNASSTALYNQYVRQLKERVALTLSALEDEQLRNAQVFSQIQNIQGTVNEIQKTNSIDKELLEKYSKVYFLNENYLPAQLAPIPITYVQNTDRVLLFQSNALPFLTNMMETANRSGVHLRVISSYRSFGDQAALKSSYKMTYGTGANAFSADQGYSEHQLGTAVDLTTQELGDSFTKFASSAAYEWMQQHAHEYGFILSYPKDNTYYQFEPWHWRFVGIQLATKLFNEKENFYDMDQRDIDQYRMSLFDSP